MLSRVQSALLVTLFAAIPTSFRHILWLMETTGPATVYPEFRGVVLFLPDLILTLLVLVTSARVFSDPSYRQHLLDVVSPTKTVAPWGVFAAWVGISVLWSHAPVLTLYQFAQLALSLLTAWIAAVQVRECPALLTLFAIAAAIHALTAIAQMLTGGSLGLPGERVWDPNAAGNLGERTLRGYAFAVHPNNLAGYLIIALTCCALVLERTRVRWQQIAGWAALGIITVGLLATISRTAIAAALVGATVFLLAAGRWKLLAVGIVAGVLAGGLLFGPRITERLRAFRTPAWVVSRVLYAYPPTLAAYREAPLLGTGAGSLLVTAAPGAEPGILLPAHNAYLMILAEVGPVGVTAFAAGVVTVLLDRHAPLSVRAGVLAISLAMLFDYYFWGDLRTRTALCVLLGVWLGSHDP